MISFQISSVVAYTLQSINDFELQRENFKLRSREYKYYRDAHKDQLPAVPIVNEADGGLSNSSYFNFLNYVLLKTCAKYLPSETDRTQFCRALGARMLTELAADIKESMQGPF